jgi:hypothetical protein
MCPIDSFLAHLNLIGYDLYCFVDYHNIIMVSCVNCIYHTNQIALKSMLNMFKI